MLTVTILRGIPGAGKSFWAKEEVRKSPETTVRLNLDDIRSSLFNSHFSKNNEKLAQKILELSLIESLKAEKDCILDNTNLNKEKFERICKVVKNLNIDCTVIEKTFYIPLAEAISRDSQREGTAKVGEKVIKMFWDKSGKEGFKNYKPKIEMFSKADNSSLVQTLEQDKTKIKCIVVDLDGTLAKIGNRSPYDASTCYEVDSIYEHVANIVKLHFQYGYHIIFCSGRMEKDKESTTKFINQHLPEIKYDLFMRATNDIRKDVIIKEEIYNKNIKPTYYVEAWFDDRLQVCQWVYKQGLPLFRVNDPCSSF